MYDKTERYNSAKLKELSNVDDDIKYIFTSLPDVDGMLPWKIGDPSKMQMAKDLRDISNFIRNFKVQRNSADANTEKCGNCDEKI